MAKPQISIRWNSNSPGAWEASKDALRWYEPEPELKGTVTIKGVLPREGLEKILAIAQEHGAEIGMALVATWANDDDMENQLRLFTPESGRKAAT